MNQTKNLKKPADMNEMERVKARKDLRYYPGPDYLKDRRLEHGGFNRGDAPGLPL